MKLKNLVIKSGIILGVVFASGCKDYLNVNKDPNNILDAPIEQLLTTATTSVGFTGGSDLHRYSSLLAQQFSGQGTGATTQNQEYERYNITGSDVNNLWANLYATTLSDLELVINKAKESNSPHYGGIAKIMKAYTYSIIVDTWGSAPYSEAAKFTDNLKPKFDAGADIYNSLFTLLDEGIADIKAATSVKSPGVNSTIYTNGDFVAQSRPKWEKLANTIKLRMLLHYSKIDKPGMVTKMNALITSGTFMAANADNFEMNFFNSPRNQNPIHQFEIDRVNQFFPNATLVDMMNTKSDPRRATYFTFNGATTTYKGAKGGDAPSLAYSRIFTFLRGDTLTAGGATGSGYTYTGAAPIRLLTFAEYNFIRAEAAVLGATGNAETFFQAGITASMQAAKVPAAAIAAYIAANGTLTGTDAQKIKQIIEEKFVANYGVVSEPWTDWRRTGFPTLAVQVPNPIVPAIARSLFYPQSEIDLNPNAPKQKTNVLERVFWDAQ
ncbi:MAG: hypothetical protein RL757_443 [Bacteroidota bacterium]|jgi:hypothetical protein